MRTGTRLLRRRIPQEIVNKVQSGSDPVLNDKARHATDLLCSEPVLSALWNIKFFVSENSSQGTSPLEGLNSRFSASKPQRTSGTTYETALMFVSSVIYKSNLR